jgi:hypothetical protein
MVSLCANACKGMRLVITIIIIAISSAKTVAPVNEIMLLPVVIVVLL